jgi:hypothetical protein
LSPVRTASRAPFRLDMLRHPRCGIPREFATCFSIALPKSERVLFAPSQREGAERRNGATCRACSCEEHATSLVIGQSRLTALHCGVLSSLVPHFLSVRWLRHHREGVKDIDPRPHNGPGGCPPRTPGTTTANRGRRHRSPSTLSFALQSAPQRMGMNPGYSWDPAASSIIKNYFVTPET